MDREASSTMAGTVLCGAYTKTNCFTKSRVLARSCSRHGHSTADHSNWRPPVVSVPCATSPPPPASPYTLQHCSVSTETKVKDVRLHVLTAASMKMRVFWGKASRSLTGVDRCFGGAYLWNVGVLQQDYTALYPRRLSPSNVKDHWRTWRDQSNSQTQTRG
jgi:hypothetical protein